MKMSDVFNGDLVPTDTTTGMQSTRFGLADGGLILRRLDHMQAAAHAINQHDQLTAINQELVEALSGLIDDIGMNHHIHTDNMIGGSTRESLAMAEEAIKRSKELTK